MKKYSKKKAEPNQPGPGFRTRRDFKVHGSMFDRRGNSPKINPTNKNPVHSTSFRQTQHKG